MFSPVFYVLLLIWGLCQGSENFDISEEGEKFRSTMAPNSKFLNPHLDDYTNLQLAIAAFANEISEPEDGKSKVSTSPVEVSSVTTTFDEKTDSRRGKSLKNWDAITLLNSILARGSNRFRSSKKL